MACTPSVRTGAWWFVGCISFAGLGACDDAAQDVMRSDPEAVAQPRASGEVALNVVALNAGRAQAAATLESDPPDTAWSIVAGPPDAMTVYVKSIHIDGAGVAPATLFTSPDPRGTPLALTSGAVDLHQLGDVATDVPVGHYQQVTLVLSRAAEVKGCVSGNFAGATSVTGPGIAGPHAANTYTSESLSEGGHTFCTIGSRSQLSVGAFTTDLIGSNADFEAQADPEWVEVDIGGNQGTSETADEVRAGQLVLGYPVDFVVEAPALSLGLEGASTTTVVTLVIDLNRMLRYFANTRTDFNPPNPNMKSGTSYFFTTVFAQSTGVFVGAAGSIDGYKLRVEGPGVVIPGWMSLVRGADGAVVTGVVMPDDDNTLTILKGAVVPEGVHAAEGGVEIPFELGPGNGALVGFAFQELGDPESSCTLEPLDTTGAQGPFTVFYSRQL